MNVYGLNVAVLTTDVPFSVISLTWYALPASKSGDTKVIVADALFSIDGSGVEIVAATPLINALLIVAGVLPELVTKTSKVSSVASTNAMFVIDTCSALPMNPMVIPPIHAATTTLTATVTAIKMIDAITGLRAFEFFLNFLYVFILVLTFL
jgi:hypothetical protein